jgi:hypothetical protein
MTFLNWIKDKLNWPIRLKGVIENDAVIPLNDADKSILREYQNIACYITIIIKPLSEREWKAHL